MPGSREVDHFNDVYESELRTQDLVLAESDKRRYAGPTSRARLSREYDSPLLAPLEGKKVLEIACGNGHDACLAADLGAEVYAYDVSPIAVDLTRKRAEINGLSDRVHLQVCGRIEEAFAGEQFDVVMGFAALHHLGMESLAESIRGRLKVGGLAVFVEPVIYSKGLAWLRSRIPYRPVEVTEDEQPLNDAVLASLAEPFGRMERREFEAVSRIYPLFHGHKSVVRALLELDYWLMKIKPLRRCASVVVFALHRDG